MPQSMIIEWDVKWPHAGNITAGTAANITVSRQSRGGNGEVREGV